MKTLKEKMLLKRKYLLAGDKNALGVDKRMTAFYAAQLLNKFGVLVDKPNLVTPEHVSLISELYGINIPKSFYANPQDMKYFTCEELLLEQIIGYNFNYGADSSESSRIELFAKALPNYEEGKEIVFRDYKIITLDEADQVLFEIGNNLALYTRKWSESEAEEFEYLYREGFYNSESKAIKGKDNAVEMFNKFPEAMFAQSLDRKDIIKLSTEMVGIQKEFKYSSDQKNRLFVAVRNARKCPMSKRQAKYFNTIAKKVGISAKETNAGSPYKKAVAFMKQDNPVAAAQVFAKSGSLLSRNMVWLLSRSSLTEAVTILDMVEVTNPVVTMQFLQSLLDNSNEPRTFSFYRDRKINNHTETEKEAKYRKSVLSAGTKKTVKEVLLRKVDKFYENLGGLGKVFIDDKFKKVAVPFNTSANSDGIDVVVTGTRQPIKGDFIRFFTYWHNVCDIDSSMLFVNKAAGIKSELSWRTSNHKPFGHSALTSGDDTSRNGAEYIDIKLSELEALGWEYGIYQLNAYSGKFNQGETFCGYQNKEDLNTKAWKPNNMALKVKLSNANSKNYIGFVVDIKTREIIIINQMQNNQNRTITNDVVGYLSKYINNDYVDQFNIFKIASLRADSVVTDPALADIIFSDETFELTEDQKQIRTTDIDKMVPLMM